MSSDKWHGKCQAQKLLEAREKSETIKLFPLLLKKAYFRLDDIERVDWRISQKPHTYVGSFPMS